MSYGLRVRSTLNNELVIDENFSCPRFVGKITRTFIETVVIDGYTFDIYDTGHPLHSEGMIFWTIPESLDDNVFFFFELFTFYASNQSVWHRDLLVMRPAAGAPYTIPEGYLFELNPIGESSDQYGLKVRKPNGNIAFDSGYQHLQLFSVEAGIQKSITDNQVATTLPFTPPAKPAFGNIWYGSEIWNNNGNGTSTGTTKWTGFRRNGNVITTVGRTINISTEDVAFNSTIQFGRNSGANPVINAAFYDVLPQGNTPANPVFSYSDYCRVEITSEAARFTGREVDKTGEGFHHPSPGARIRFSCAGPTVLIYLNYTNLLNTSEWYNGWGAVLVNGSLHQNFHRVQGAGAITVTLNFGTVATRTIEVVLPYGASVDFTGATGGEYPITAAPARSTVRWVAMGDSISQGYLASTQANSWLHLLCQAKNWQMINHGLGGRRCHPSDGSKLASLNPTIASYLIGYNEFNQQTPLVTFKADFRSFILKFREGNTTAKLYCITPIWSPNVKTIPLEDYRKQIREVISELGNSLNILVEGTSLMTNDTSRLVDTIHPNNTGHSEIYSALNGIMSL